MSDFKQIFDYDYINDFYTQLSHQYRIPAYELHDFLSLLGVNTSLKRFVVVLEKFDEIAKIVEGIFHGQPPNYVWSVIEEAHQTCKKLLRYRSYLNQNANLKRKIGVKQNTSMKGTIEKSPLYGTLAYLPKSRATSSLKAFNQLLAQTLIAKIIIEQFGVNQFVPLLEKALYDIRNFTSKEVHQLPVNSLLPGKYLEKLENISDKGRLESTVKLLSAVSDFNSHPISPQSDLGSKPTTEEGLKYHINDLTREGPHLKTTIPVYENQDLPEADDIRPPRGLVYVFPKFHWARLDARKVALAAAKTRSRENQRSQTQIDLCGLKLIFSTDSTPLIKISEGGTG